MLVLGPLGFTAPWLLLGLVLLPVLWLLLRAVPPAPIRRRFPGVALLLGLRDEDSQSDTTPWWLLLLRMAAVAAVILAFAGPVLNPQEERTGRGPMLVLIDGTWADAADWQRRVDRAEGLLAEAARADRPAAVVSLTDLAAGAPQFQAPDVWASRLAGLRPRPWAPQPEAVADWAAGLDGRFETVWLSDGVARPVRADLLGALEDRGPVRVVETPRPVLALTPPRFEDGAVVVPGLRTRADGPLEVDVAAQGLDPGGVMRELATGRLAFRDGEGAAEMRLTLPPELRNRITRFEVQGLRSAGAVTLTDDALKRREVALIAATEGREGLQLLSPTHYQEQALEPTADLVSGALPDVLVANPDVIVLADVAQLADPGPLVDWVEEGGLLLRFAGDRVAASDVSRDAVDPLMPVRLRRGGRSVGGAMSWGEPKGLAPFPPDSPFVGLEVPDEVRVTAQVMAEPGPDLAQATIAALADGTPLVTRKRLGEGQVVLFHVTANAEWSSVPLSGLFVQMLERLAVSTRPAVPDAEDLEGTVWVADELLTAFGEVTQAETQPGIPGAMLAEAAPGPDSPPGLYAGEERRVALNVLGRGDALTAASWPDRIPVEGLRVARETDLKGWVIAAAIALFMADVVGSLLVSGRLTGGRDRSAGGAAAALAAFATLATMAAPAAAQAPPGDTGAKDAFAIEATEEVALAHVRTGDAQVDDVAAAGLRGLSDMLYRRTSVEPAAPIAVDVEADELSFFPFLYWPVTPDQPTPSGDAYAKLNRYLRSGGMILFDTRDADVAAYGTTSPNGSKLQALAAPLDIPPLEPVPADHVLTRTFYLLQDFPGRHQGRDVWVESAPADAEQIEGMPFRNLNDNVTPVVIGGNDWATAWAVDEGGAPMFPVGRGYAGERQREVAYRFGINLVMHVLTGNYKSDQVHVPALLDRLGQ